MCFFHWIKSIYRWILKNGFRVDYVSNGRFRSDIRMLASIAFIPPSFIEAAFDELCPLLCHNARLVANYIERTFIRGNMDGALVFRPHLWSVYKRTLEGRNRTNNPVEGLNNRLRNLIGRKKPGFWVLVEKLQEEDRASTAKITKSFGAHSGEVADDDEDCLKAIVQKFDQMTTIEYLKSISNFVMTGETFLPDDDE